MASESKAPPPGEREAGEEDEVKVPHIGFLPSAEMPHHHSIPVLDYLEAYGATSFSRLFWELADPSWRKVLDMTEVRNTLFSAEAIRIQGKRLKGDLEILPNGPCRKMFNAFQVPFPPKAVFLGQNPYPNPDHAHGYSFSVGNGDISGSLKTILEANPALTLGSGNLQPWVEQGVFLFNVALTTMSGVTSIQGTGGLEWKHFAELIMAACLKCKTPIAFVILGEPAKKVYLEAKEIAGDVDRHLVIMAPHPSPRNGKAFMLEGKNLFTRINSFLRSTRSTALEWSIEGANGGTDHERLMRRLCPLCRGKDGPDAKCTSCGWIANELARKKAEKGRRK